MKMLMRLFRMVVFPVFLYCVMPATLGVLLIEKCTRESREKFLLSEVNLCHSQLAASEVRRTALEAIYVRKEIDSTNDLLKCMKNLLQESTLEAKRMEAQWRKQTKKRKTNVKKGRKKK